ncbi:histidine kinase dimerization/phospho-acceptor domain-containing protein [Chryseobacterium indoltheticum]|uniref:histidine kinase dimerization/phospho-acceptor domain-containing protein n=1 Tax=Chryseobacterium indoltheticum TaxID=254 RepID=UPI003F49469E
MHDLKNPLTSIRLSAQLIASKKDLSEERRLEMAENIIEGAKLITEMMDKVYRISEEHRWSLEFETIDPNLKYWELLKMPFNGTMFRTSNIMSRIAYPSGV